MERNQQQANMMEQKISKQRNGFGDSGEASQGKELSQYLDKLANL